MPDPVVADAPGRVNLIGDHTDSQEGFVMPCALPLRTTATVVRRNDRRVHAVSASMGGPIEYELGYEQPGLGWGDHVQGVTHALALAGHEVRGFELALHSDVPPAIGLGSSAALEVAILRAVRLAFMLPVDEVQIARLAQRAEMEFIGPRTGIMDQMASSLGSTGAALFLDTRSLAWESIPLPTELGLVVIDSGVRPLRADGEFLARRTEAEEAARLLGVRCLRDVSSVGALSLADLTPTLLKRARHIVSENERVLRASDALRAGDLEMLGRLFTESHASLRDDYQVSTPEIERLVALADGARGVYGARVTGCGFGGCIVAATAASRARDVAAEVSRAYREATGLAGTIHLPLNA